MNDRELAAAYVLEELDPTARAALEVRLEAEPELRQEVDALRPLMASLTELPGEAWPVEDPPPRQAALAPIRAPRVWRLRPAVALGAILAALVSGGLLGAALDSSGGESGKPVPSPQISLQPLGSSSAASAKVTMPKPDEMALSVQGLPRSEPGQYYELWLMSDARRTVPVASFRVGADGAAMLRVPLPADPSSYRYFDISRQAETAGTGHSADSVLRGPTSPS